MVTARIDCLLFGYRQYKIANEKTAEVSSRLLGTGVSVIMKSDGSFDVRERDVARVRPLLYDIEYTESEPKGLLGRYKRYRYKAPLFCALIFSFALVALSSGVVWDIRIEGNSGVPDAAVIEELEKCGFSVGDLWAFSDRSKIEGKILSSSSDIGWININRRGTVAYVTVVERENTTDEGGSDEGGLVNIVAADDCVIEEITVVSGQAIVKAGDIVKKGDVLILGVLPDEAGGGFCRAEGRVVGRMSDSVSVVVDRNYEQKHKADGKTIGVTLNFFGFDLNIFKNYGNLPEKCDIIEEIKTVSLFGRCRLPIVLSREICEEYESVSGCYTDAELVAVACARLREQTSVRLEKCDLLKIRTDGAFTETGYRVTNHITFTSEVGIPLPFEVE